MTDDELRQLIASNARAIQAAADERSELHQTMLDVADERAQLRQAILKLTDIQQGISNLRKLNTIWLGRGAGVEPWLGAKPSLSNSNVLTHPRRAIKK
ncbi:hypothetical protein [Leptothermofonsia sp. ETS-13]|uniref:hypothetical protein n=1 Tax=Leptothermofonsia sp. ETS-13 TaxID=3035696 RepID=UPI003B9F0979